MKRKYQKEIGYHIIFWISYIIIWSVRDLVHFPDYFFRTLVINSWQTFLALPLVYLNLYFLLPKYLLRIKHLIYFIALGLTILAATFYLSITNSLIFTHVYFFLDTAEYYSSPNGQLVLFTEVVVLNFSAMSFVLFRTWYKNDLKLKMTEKEKLEGELKLLKQQIQPHFIFNALNTIYMLMQRDEEVAKDTLMNFSEVLSHQLYESQKDYISLDKEIGYLRNYFEIEKIRQGDSLQLTVKIARASRQLLIAPMILVPFVENAFKHGSQSDNYWVNLTIEFDEESMHMNISNSYCPQAKENANTTSGIGIENVKKRLDLLYPQSHRLEIEKGEKEYKVGLTIKLSQVS